MSRTSRWWLSLGLAVSTSVRPIVAAIIVGRVHGTPVAQVPYASVLLWTTGASILISVVVRTALETARPSETRRADVRDRDIARFGEYASRWCIIIGATAGLFMAVRRVDQFWIANVIYLGFVLWAVVGSVIRLVAYRRGI